MSTLFGKLNTENYPTLSLSDRIHFEFTYVCKYPFPNERKHKDAACTSKQWKHNATNQLPFYSI